MLALSVLATIVALAVAGVSIAGVLQRFVIEGLDQRLDAELSLLAGAVRNDGSVDRARLAQKRGLLDAGPGWRWQIAGPAGTFGSADMPAFDEPRRREHERGEDHRPRPAEEHGPGREVLHARTITIDTAAGPIRLTAAAPADVVARPIRGALLPLLALLAILGVVLALSTLVQLRVGLRPLRQLRDEVAAIRTGRATVVAPDQPAELLPLVAELNALARDNAAALATARASAANLAHALKTPVATLSLTVAGEAAAQVARIDQTIRHHLARARGDAADRRAATRLAPVIDDLAHVIARLHPDRGIAIESRVAADLMVVIDAADLQELAGNLIDNAMRHARNRIVIHAMRQGRMVVLAVADDGSGIAPADVARAMEPGVRLDERGEGHGFGLAIARELAELHGGALALHTAPDGGLVATVTLPFAIIS